MVHDYGVDRFSAWGTTTSGVPFCCAQSDANILELEMYGGGNNDVMAFTYSNLSGTWNLKPSYAVGIPKILAHMFAEGGDDTPAGFLRCHRRLLRGSPRRPGRRHHLRT